MVRKLIYSPFQIYIVCIIKKNSKRDIFILAEAMLNVTCILKSIRILLEGLSLVE